MAGGKVLLTPGTFKVTASLALVSNLTMEGYGAASIIKGIFAAGTQRIIANDLTNGNSNITLLRFRLDRSGSNAQHGMFFGGITNLLIDGVEVVGLPSASSGAIAISGGSGLGGSVLSSGIRVINCYFSQTDDFGVQVGNVTNVVIANNVFANCIRECIGVEPATGDTAQNVSIIGNTITTGSKAAGLASANLHPIIVTISSGGTVEGAIVLGNVVQSTTTYAGENNNGILILASDCVIMGNTVIDMSGDSIHVGSLSSSYNNNIIIGNRAINCNLGNNVSPYGAGIFLSNAHYTVVKANIITGASLVNAVAEDTSGGDADNNVIEGNIFRDVTTTLRKGDATIIRDNFGDGSGVWTLERLQAWVADNAQNPSLGTLPANSYVKSVAIQVTEAFNSDGTDNIEVGWDADNDALATATDVSTTGIKTPTLGASAGFNSSAQAIEAYYTNGGSEPTTGKALVTVEYYRVAAQVA